MTYRKLYSMMLGTIAMGLASCATDINNESESQIDAGTSAKRTLTITTENEPLTRSSVSLINGNKWVKGDKFIAYNLTTPNGFDYIVAIEGGKTMKFEGEVTCKKGDNIALFYPFKQNDYGVTPGNVSVSLDQNTVIENGNPVTGKQDGTIENIKYVDYSWGLAKNISTTDFKGWGNINFRKQYALLLVKFCNDGKPIKNIKSLTISNEPSKGEFNLKTGQYVFPSKIDNPSSYTFTINPSAPLDSFYVAVFPNDNYRPVFTIETTDGSEYEQALTDGMRIERARYYTITMNMGCTPWVDIDGVKWSRYNLHGLAATTWLKIHGITSTQISVAPLHRVLVCPMQHKRLSSTTSVGATLPRLIATVALSCATTGLYEATSHQCLVQPKTTATWLITHRVVNGNFLQRAISTS